MKLLAVIDATDNDAPEGPATQIAGLSLLERTVRLADVCGADEIAVWCSDPPQSAAFASDQASVEASLTTLTDDQSFVPSGDYDAVLLLSGAAVFDRSFVQHAVDQIADASPGQARRSADSHLVVARPHDTASSEWSHRDLAEMRAGARPQLSEGWIISVDSPKAVRRAERRLWNSCRKPEDGLVARYFNRHLSIAMSRLLVATPVKPNHITALTFALGIAAGIAAARGEYLGFLIAGLLYQLNSVVDGVDGELARVRYEFSFLGEWLDTISDDLADLAIYVGLGIGAWRTIEEVPGPFGPELWLVLGAVAAAGKLASMVVYYRWLIANERGDLLAFQWSFEDDSAADTASARLLSTTRYFFRKDFIVFVAMIASFGGVLPHLLFALAPGNLLVAASVVIQQLGGRAPS